MADVLPPVVILVSILLVSILTLAVAIRTLLSSRRSEIVGEDRYELLRDQWDRLEFVRQERRMLLEELERESRERQQLTEFLGKTPSQLVEDLKKEREEHLEANRQIEDLKQEGLRLEQELHQLKEQLDREREGHIELQRRAEQLEQQQKEQSGIQQEMERLGQERQRLTEDLEREREKHLGAQQRAEQQEQERARLENELRSLRAELDSHSRAPTRDRVKASEPSHPWWRRPVLVVGLLLGALLMWLTSLAVALYLVSP
jgi:chromosome segregation ATPase